VKTPLLSICIATFNRAEYIGETLESIIPQVTDDVEIVIVDGASTDNTSSIVRHYIEVCKQIHYIQLPSKGGVDQDFCKAVEYAKGEYCWLFTDDDLLKAGAIEQVLFEISKGYSLIIVNSEVWNQDFTTLIFEKHLSDKAQTVYEPHEFEVFFQHCVSYLSFIGAVVIKKNIWKERDKDSYFGTGFVHIGVIFQKLLPTTIRVITKPYIKIRYGNAQWSSRKFEIWMIQWPMLLWSFDVISQTSKQNIIAREPWRNLKELFVYRSLSAYNIKVLQKLISNYTISYLWLFFAKCISLFPVKLAKRILIKYYAIRGKAKDLTYYDLLEEFNNK
jgi:glycosyltransferase involved in cell wall biosynthesis